MLRITNEKIDSGQLTDKYNVVYKTMGKSDRSAMPLGNGVTGISLWVEEDGDLQFYIGHTDAQTEVDRNVKLGKVILKLEPNPFISGAEFTQELLLREGCVNITARKGNEFLNAKVFVASDAQNIYVDVNSTIPIKATAELYSWRTGERELWEIPNKESEIDSFIKESADKIYCESDGVVFYHKNATTCVKSVAVIEALAEHMDKIVDTLENRTFGGFLTLTDGIAYDCSYISSKQAKKQHTLKITTFCVQQADTEKLIKQLIKDHNNMPEIETAFIKQTETDRLVDRKNKDKELMLKKTKNKC